MKNKMYSPPIRLESRDLPESTFWKRNKTPASAPAAPTAVALLPAAADDDKVTVTCILQKSPDCEKTFTESTSRWLATKDSTGIAFQVPKSCGPCRRPKRQIFNLHRDHHTGYQPPDQRYQPPDSANLTVAFDIDPGDDFAMAAYAPRCCEP